MYHSVFLNSPVLKVTSKARNQGTALHTVKATVTILLCFIIQRKSCQEKHQWRLKHY